MNKKDNNMNLNQEAEKLLNQKEKTNIIGMLFSSFSLGFSIATLLIVLIS